MSSNTRTLVNVQRLPEADRNELRKKAFEMFSQSQTAYAVGKALRITNKTACAWKKKYIEQGKDAFTEQKRGPVTSIKALLTPKQLLELKKVIIDKTPDQLKFNFALWSSKAVKEYVQKKFRVSICRRTARRYMKALGFTYQCPIKRAREQNQQRVKSWLKHQYPAIRRESKKRGAKILWADESHVDVSTLQHKGYSPKGKPPVLKCPANRSVSCSMISAVGNQGDLSFMIFKGAMNVEKFQYFLEQVIKEHKNVSLIVDNLKVHHAKDLAPFLKKNRNKLRLYYLPSYSPELNPDEQLNQDTKAALAEQKTAKSEATLKAQVTKHLKSRKKDRDAVKKLFDNPECSYAKK